MNLQQLRYIVATADEGTMTRAAERLHVAQPALSRAVRALEREIGVTVFERKGRGVRITRQGEDVVAGARRILSELDRLMTLGRQPVLQVCAVSGQAREVGTPATAAYVTAGHGRVALDVADTCDEVCDRVRSGVAHLGIVELPPPPDMWATSLGWQEVVLVHPADWSLDDPVDAARLADLPLLSPAKDNWRRAAMEDNLRSLGVPPLIAAETTDRDLIPALVASGAGAWFSYGRQAQTAVAHGARLVHLDPTVVREIGIVAMSEPAGPPATFVEVARTETVDWLLPVGDPVLDGATWISAGEILGTSPPPTTIPSLRPVV
jgi:DNA-binding transcriptional LysR family regulator